MLDCNAMRELLKRVVAAKGADREIDVHVWLALHPEYRQWGGSPMYVPRDEPDNWLFTDEQAKAYGAARKKLKPPISDEQDHELLRLHATPHVFDPKDPLKAYTFTGGGQKSPLRRWVPEISHSIDAAVALVGKALPGDWLVGFEWGQRGTIADAWVRWKFAEHGSEAQGRTPALAILAALLSAKIAQAEAEGV